MGMYSTQGFLQFDEVIQADFMEKAMGIFNSSKIDFVVGDPVATEYSEEDEGRTARVPFGGDEKVYAIKEWHDDRQETVITFLLASEY